MRRRLAVVAVAVAVSLIAACTTDSDSAAEDDGTGTTAPPPAAEKGTDTETGESAGSDDGGTEGVTPRSSAVAQGDGTAVLRILFVHGSYEGDDGTLGAAVRGDVAAIFVDQIDAAAGVIGSSSAIERSVSTHELGHLLGLVDLYLDTGRDDPDHPGHSTNRNSVMFWAVESDVIGQLLGANPPDTFDAADRPDLDAVRGGA